jgi:iron complex transport system substrate-binding protein
VNRASALLVSMLLLGLGSCRDPIPPETPPQTIQDDRVDRFDPGIDYFPEKTTLKYAKGFAVEYHNNYKILAIDPDLDGQSVQRFALVQRGTPAPADFPANNVIDVPVRRFGVLNFVWEGLIDEMDLEQRLVGVYSYRTTTSPAIRKLIDDRKISQLGCCAYVDVETLAVARPDVVITGYAKPDPASQLLAQARIKSLAIGTIWETSMLARAEWSKLFGLLFNREHDAEARFNRIAQSYEALSARAVSAGNKPLVLTGYPTRDKWISSWEFLRFVKDAGATVFTPRQPEDMPVNLQAEIPFEAAMERGRHASFWVFLPDFVGSFQALLALEQRLSLLPSVQQGAVYDVCKACTAELDSPYWSGYLANPDKVLADLVHILKPEVLPQHQLVYMRVTPRGGS